MEQTVLSVASPRNLKTKVKTIPNLRRLCCPWLLQDSVFPAQQQEGPGKRHLLSGGAATCHTRPLAQPGPLLSKIA